MVPDWRRKPKLSCLWIVCLLTVPMDILRCLQLSNRLSAGKARGQLDCSKKDCIKEVLLDFRTFSTQAFNQVKWTHGREEAKANKYFWVLKHAIIFLVSLQVLTDSNHQRLGRLCRLLSFRPARTCPQQWLHQTSPQVLCTRAYWNLQLNVKK